MTDRPITNEHRFVLPTLMIMMLVFPLPNSMDVHCLFIRTTTKPYHIIHEIGIFFLLALYSQLHTSDETMARVWLALLLDNPIRSQSNVWFRKIENNWINCEPVYDRWMTAADWTPHFSDFIRSLKIDLCIFAYCNWIECLYMFVCVFDDVCCPTITLT